MEFKRVLRLVILILIFLAVARLFHSSSGTDDQEAPTHNRKVQIMNPGRFWMPGRIPQVNRMTPHPVPEEVETVRKVEPTIKIPVQEVKNATSALLNKVASHPLRVVHLDLKGAAPKVSYLQQLFPLLSSLGADGVLMEYEDMFPYEGSLQILRSTFSYSLEDLKEIKHLAELYKLELIPLVQVFGHLEFVLKHEKYINLREVAEFPNSLNPQVSGGLDLIKEMLSQVLKMHPEAKWFHIGADEVYGLGQSTESKNWVKNHGTIESLFLSHVTKVCRFMSEQRPGLKLLFWEDMLRKFSHATIKESGMTKVASPMIWKYDSNMDITKIGKLLSHYQNAGFKDVWFASAFKGASGIDQMWTPINHHLQNHQAWLKVMASMTNYPTLTLQGVVLTGWQRYEHHSVLCELLPVGIPSLATCLQTLKHGSFNDVAQNETQDHLGCRVRVSDNSCQGAATFPGSEIYNMVEKIYKNLKKSVDQIMNDNYVRGTFSKYQRKYSFGNPRNIQNIKNSLQKFLKEWEPFLENLQKKMDTIFFSDTVEEWLEENVNPHMDKVRSLADDLDHTIKLKGKPKSPNPLYVTKKVL